LLPAVTRMDNTKYSCLAARCRCSMLLYPRPGMIKISSSAYRPILPSRAHPSPTSVVLQNVVWRREVRRSHVG
jgi:hypothetical protein